MEEYAATYDDDDIKFVGTLNEATGRFTPNIEGPNPARSGHETMSATSGWSRKCLAMRQRASRRRRFAPARTCW